MILLMAVDIPDEMHKREVSSVAESDLKFVHIDTLCREVMSAVRVLA